jgi:hypothetical protein
MTYAIRSFEFHNVCLEKAIAIVNSFMFNEVKKEREEMNKVNDQYDINYCINRKKKKKAISRTTQKRVNAY